MVLLRAQFPNDTYRERINRLLRGTELKSALAGRAQTNGRLNLARALTSTTNRPFNDDFADRAIITGTTLTLRSNNRGATIEPGEPGHAGTDDAGASLWWLWIAPATGTVVVDTAGSDFDTTLDIFTGSTLATLVPVTSNDNYGSTVTSRVAFPVTALTSYIIAVSGKTNTSGYAQLSISPAPANDHFANATPLAGESAQSTARNNSATTEPTEPRILGFAGGASLWYKWTAPRTGRFQVSAFTFDFNTLLAVYTGSSLANLALVAANDDTDLSATIQNSDSRCTVAATAGTTYYFQVDTKNPTSRGLVTVSVTDSLWQLSTDGSLVTNSVSVGPDGTLYLGTTSPDSRVYAVNPDGSLKWTYAAGASMDLATPAIGPDGMIYFGAFDGNVTALTPAGTVRWQRALGTGSTSFAPALAADGTLYTHHTNGSLYALSSADGTVKWSYNVGNVGSYYTAAIIAPDGTVYQGSVDKNLYALNPNGTLRWKFATGGDMLATPRPRRRRQHLPRHLQHLPRHLPHSRRRPTLGLRRRHRHQRDQQLPVPQQRRHNRLPRRHRPQSPRPRRRHRRAPLDLYHRRPHPRLQPRRRQQRRHLHRRLRRKTLRALPRRHPQTHLGHRPIPPLEPRDFRHHPLPRQ
jgi:outer membrane protein assembly factor BamB